MFRLRWSILNILFIIKFVIATELSFELADNAKECFFEEIHKNTSVTLEFQVVTGGQYDVDVSLFDPRKTKIYEQIKTQFDSHTFTTQLSGVYMICFSNEFSTISHKLVYMDLQVGEEAPLPGLGEHITALTKMESSAQETHKSLSTIIDFQTHHRLREAQGRKRAEELNETVLWWSIIETAVIIVISIGQVMILKNFFTDRRPANFK